MAFEIDNPIPDDEKLFRHVPKAKRPQDYWVTAQNRPTSAAFRDKDKGREVSVDRAKYGGCVESVLRERTLAVVSLVAGKCRPFYKEVLHDPVEPEEPYGPNPAHSIICDPYGPPLPKEIEHSVRSSMASVAQLEWMAPGEPDFQ